MRRDVPNGKAASERSAVRECLEQLAGARPHDAQHRFRRRRIEDRRTHVEIVRTAFDPGAVLLTACGARDDAEGVFAAARDGYVRLDPAALIEHLCVDGPVFLDFDVIGAEPSASSSPRRDRQCRAW